METIGSKRSYALIWCMPNNDDDDDLGVRCCDCLFQELLKTHLMFAVREEVEQLKEQITTLTDRNAQLEYENTLLKARASQETLALLSVRLSVDE